MSVHPVAAAGFKPQAVSANASATASSFLDALKAQNARPNAPGGASALASSQHHRHHHASHRVASATSANGQTSAT